MISTLYLVAFTRDSIARVKATALALLVWVIAAWHELRERIHEARHPKRKKFDPNHVPVFVPPQAGPLVETVASKDALLLTQVPIRSTKADAKREALAYARQRSKNPSLQWKAARRLLNQWEREEREIERSMTPEYAEKMSELTEAAAH